jgi:hypothetical protein
MEFDASAVAHSGRFSPVRRVEFPFDQALNLDGLVGRAMSASYVPKTGPGAAKLIEMLRDLHARHADDRGIVFLRYTTEVYLAETRPEER